MVKRDKRGTVSLAHAAGGGNELRLRFVPVEGGDEEDFGRSPSLGKQ